MIKLKEPKVFNLAEARETLPFVKRIVTDIVETHNELSKAEKEIQLTNDLRERRRKISHYAQLKQNLEEYQKELDLVGCHLKNPHLGIVGFYWTSNDKIAAELCWKYGEEDIHYWQEIGNSKLHPLEETNR